LRSEGPRSILTLVEVRDDKAAAPRDRIKAATELLNRAGMSAVSEHHHFVDHQLSESEQDKRILQLAKELGLDEANAMRLLVSPDEFKKNSKGIYELEPKPAPSPERQKKRDLERVRQQRQRDRKKMTQVERDTDRA